MAWNDFSDYLTGKDAGSRHFLTLRPGQVEEAKGYLDPIRPQEDYFEVRLSGMALGRDRKLWVDYLPMVMMVSRFLFDGKQRVLPFIVGHQMLDPKAAEAVDGRPLAFRNIRCIGPVPFSGGELSLFVGLFAVPARDLAGGLLSLVEDLVGAFDAGVLSEYLKIARVLESGLSRLLKLRGIELRVGGLRDFDDTGDASTGLCDSYLAGVHGERGDLSEERLRVRDGRLHMDATHGRELDYALLHIRRRSTRNDYISLPFHRHWKEAQRRIWEGGLIDAARSSMLHLNEELSLSPDLTRSHSSHLLEIYWANFHDEVAKYDERTRPSTSGARGTVHRGAEAGSDPVPAWFRHAARAMQKNRVPESVYMGMMDAGKRWKELPDSKRLQPGGELSEQIIEAQLKVMGDNAAASSDPRTLSRALSIAAFSPP